MESFHIHFIKMTMLGLSLCIYWPLSAQKEDDEGGPQHGLWIETRTDKNSAGVAPGDEEEDRKRKNIGIGETVTVWLDGKPSLKGSAEEIDWDITKGLELLTKEPNLKGTDKVIFTINPNLSKKDIEKSGGIEIKVIKTEMNEKLPSPAQFTVVFPKIITGRHIEFMGNNGSTMPEGFPDGDSRSGATAQLKLTVHPLSVNFSAIKIIEHDRGLRPNPGTLATKHSTTGIWPTINDHNELVLEENIGLTDKHNLIEGPVKDQNNNPVLDENGNPKFHSFPNAWTWICLFNTYKYQVGSQGIENIDNDTICEVDQDFLINKKNGEISVKITKHKTKHESEDTERCSVERTTKGDHTFKP